MEFFKNLLYFPRFSLVKRKAALADLAHPQFLKKSPSKIRSLERRGDLMGFRVEEFGSSG